MYDEFEVSKNVSEVFKKGENLVDEDIIEYSKQCKISGVVPNPKILKLI
jgi:hypothetical protein